MWNCIKTARRSGGFCLVRYLFFKISFISAVSLAVNRMMISAYQKSNCFAWLKVIDLFVNLFSTKLNTIYLAWPMQAINLFR